MCLEVRDLTNDRYTHHSESCGHARAVMPGDRGPEPIPVVIGRSCGCEQGGRWGPEGSASSDREGGEGQA